MIDHGDIRAHARARVAAYRAPEGVPLPLPEVRRAISPPVAATVVSVGLGLLSLALLALA